MSRGLPHIGKGLGLQVDCTPLQPENQSLEDNGGGGGGVLEEDFDTGTKFGDIYSALKKW